MHHVVVGYYGTLLHAAVRGRSYRCVRLALQQSDIDVHATDEALKQTAIFDAIRF